MCCVEHVGVAAFRRVPLVVLRTLAHIVYDAKRVPCRLCDVMWLAVTMMGLLAQKCPLR